MRGRTRAGLMPGMSVLGGAAAGLSYEGALRDAVAREDRARWQDEAAPRRVPKPQTQRPRREAPPAQAARQLAQ